MFKRLHSFFSNTNSQNQENHELRPSQAVISPHFFKPGEGKVKITINRNIPVLENQEVLCDQAPSFSNPYLGEIHAITEIKVAEKSDVSEKSESRLGKSPSQNQEKMSEIFKYSASTDLYSKPAVSKVQSEEPPVSKVENWLKKNEKWEKSRN